MKSDRVDGGCEASQLVAPYGMVIKKATGRRGTWFAIVDGEPDPLP